QTRCDLQRSACASPSGSGGGAGSGGTGGNPSGPCTPGETAACYEGPTGTKGVGACKGGTRTCLHDGSGFGACVGQVTPVAENCSTPVDDNCDGQVNEECTYASCADVPKALGSGTYPISILNQGTLSVYCDLASS